MIRRIFILLLCFACTSAFALSAARKSPYEQLKPQIQRLSDLLRDSHAVLYPSATMIQSVKISDENRLVFVVFTVEGFGGGNNHTQYFAVFSTDVDAKGKKYFSLQDFMPIAGKGWRGVDELKAKVTGNPEKDELHIVLDALEVTENDGPNFPSKPIKIHLVLKNGRLTEQTQS